ncbi:lipase maturation factor family protein [Candidatus Sumerlaeota bacterium]|nr:lipase maturation factor family protein [Candidatus Sumerlaeota bacterium]
MPTLFFFGSSDGIFQFAAWTGLILSIGVMLGISNGLILLLLWALYMSFEGAGQIFWGFGWELLLLETTVLGVFLSPFLNIKWFPKSAPPPAAVIWLMRWLVFRIMLGAGLIKMRGDPCWRDLTCLVYHYETQPIPNPLSWYFHQCPVWFHKGGVLWNHFIELVVPWFVFGPRRVRHAAGVLLASFQGILILSGNLSFLNYLTIVACISCFDDRFFRPFVPAKMRDWIEEAHAQSRGSLRQKFSVGLFTAAVLILSVRPALNLIAPNQAMNAAFDPLRLVNTYGAFGGVGKTRYEIIIEGTLDERPGPETQWREYEFKYKPGNPRRRPPIVAPYQPRLDWEIWFAAMSDYQHHPWLVHLVYKLLRGDSEGLALLDGNPFPGRPPRFIRARLFEYHFTSRSDPRDQWWRRSFVSDYLRPVSLENSSLTEFVRRHGWPLAEEPNN